MDIGGRCVIIGRPVGVYGCKEHDIQDSQRPLEDDEIHYELEEECCIDEDER